MKKNYSDLSSIELMGVILGHQKKIMESEIALSFYHPSDVSKTKVALEKTIAREHDNITCAKTWYKIKLATTNVVIQNKISNEEKMRE